MAVSSGSETRMKGRLYFSANFWWEVWQMCIRDRCAHYNVEIPLAEMLYIYGYICDSAGEP